MTSSCGWTYQPYCKPTLSQDYRFEDGNSGGLVGKMECGAMIMGEKKNIQDD